MNAGNARGARQLMKSNGTKSIASKLVREALRSKYPDEPIDGSHSINDIAPPTFDEIESVDPITDERGCIDLYYQLPKRKEPRIIGSVYR